QAGVPESGGLLRAAPAGSRRQVLGVSRVARSAGAGGQRTIQVRLTAFATASAGQVAGHYVPFAESFDADVDGVAVDDDVSEGFAAGVSFGLVSFASLLSFPELPLSFASFVSFASFASLVRKSVV